MYVALLLIDDRSGSCARADRCYTSALAGCGVTIIYSRIVGQADGGAVSRQSFIVDFLAKPRRRSATAGM